MSTLDDWIDDTCRALGLPPDSVTHERRDELLDLTRDVARGVARIAGPVTTYLVGIAVGSGMPPAQAVATVAGLAAAHAPAGEDGPPA